MTVEDITQIKHRLVDSGEMTESRRKINDEEFAEHIVERTEEMMTKTRLVDSGERTNVGNDGAVRENPEEKGRMDLVPADFIVEYFSELTEFNMKENLKKNIETFKIIANDIEIFKSTANESYLMLAFTTYVEWKYPDRYVDALSELARHFGDGAKKYSEDNWKKGMPVKYYISSAERHMAKLIEGWHDEDHERALLWNLCAAWWTCRHLPEYNDYIQKGEK